jgi:hypothetical protein
MLEVAIVALRHLLVEEELVPTEERAVEALPVMAPSTATVEG